MPWIKVAVCFSTWNRYFRGWERPESEKGYLWVPIWERYWETERLIKLIRSWGSSSDGIERSDPNFFGNFEVENYVLFTFSVPTDSWTAKYQQKLIYWLNILTWYLDFFSTNLGAVTGKHGNRFHHEIPAINHRFQDKWGTSIFTDHCWTMARFAP
jgi:hypothetical protein